MKYLKSGFVVAASTQAAPSTPRRWLLACGFAALAALGVQQPAFAGAGEITTVVTPLSTAVTYSNSASVPALVTYIGYTVAVANIGGNTVNNIKFTGGIFTTAGASEKPTFIAPPDSAPFCGATNADLTEISCQIGQLTAGQAAPMFVVFFKAPVKNTLLPNGDITDCAGTDCVSFKGTTFYGEGGGGFPNSKPPNSVVCWPSGEMTADGACGSAAVLVTLGTFNPELVKSAVPKSGGTFLTGDGAIATATDTWTTSVKVPANFTTLLGATYTTAEIQEEEDLNSCASNLNTCNFSTLTIPGSFAKLQITLSRDVSTIAKGDRYKQSAVDSAVVYYSVIPVGQQGYAPFQLSNCTVQIPAAPGKPCVSSRFVYPRNAVDAKAGDWVIGVDALDNGTYRN